jgi:hypothetical protein
VARRPAGCQAGRFQLAVSTSFEQAAPSVIAASFDTLNHRRGFSSSRTVIRFRPRTLPCSLDRQCPISLLACSSLIRNFVTCDTIEREGTGQIVRIHPSNNGSLVSYINLQE